MNFDRQSGIVSRTALGDLPPVVMIGCGGIGSTTGLMLAKMGVEEMHIVDFDTIEDHNLPNQLFPIHSVGEDKVSTMRGVIDQYADNCELFTYNARFSKDLFDSMLEIFESKPIIIMAVDNMASRKEIYDITKDHSSLIIDGRMGGWVYHVYSLLPDEFSWYQANELHTDAESTPTPCTERAIIFNTAAVGADICKNVALFANKEKMNRKITRDIRNDLLILD
jgi:molybdopterin/thiamine biosynthesis adenylyltransferase